MTLTVTVNIWRALTIQFYKAGNVNPLKLVICRAASITLDARYAVNNGVLLRQGIDLALLTDEE